MKKLNKKRGFTLIELIIVIAIIAILAAIAVPAFGQIRQKANVSADLGNARTIYSLVATELASDAIQYGDGTNTVNDSLDTVGDTVTADIESKIEPKPVVKTYQNAKFVVTIDSNGAIQVSVLGGSAGDKAIGVYPEAEGKYAGAKSDDSTSKPDTK